ncbi:MAG: RND family transporter [Nitrospirota bacterium]
MNRLLNRVNRFFEHVPDFVRRHRVWIWIIFILMTVVIAAGASHFEIDMSMDAYFQKDDPVRIAFDNLKMQFDGTSTLYIVYEAKDGNIFSDASLKAVQGIQEYLMNYRLTLKSGEESPLDHIIDVKTLNNISYMEADGDSLISRRFIGSSLPETEEERERLKIQALEYHDYSPVYLSEDSRYGGIIIRTDFGSIMEDDPMKSDVLAFLNDEEEDIIDTLSEDIESIDIVDRSKRSEFKETPIPEYAAFMHTIETILNKSEYSKVLTFYPVGEAVINTFFNDIVLPEFSMLMIGFGGVICLMFFILFRSFSAVLWSILIVASATLWVTGLIGWSGAIMTTLVYLIIYLVVVVGIGDVIHILSGYLYFRNQGQDHKTTLTSVFSKSGLACFFTSLTTAIGMLSLTFIPIVPIRNTGIFSALGVIFAFIITIFLIPLMLDLWNPFSKKQAERGLAAGKKSHLIQRLLQRVEPLSYRYPIPIAIVVVISGIFLTYGALQVRIDSNVTEILPKKDPIRKAYNIVDDFMGGAQNMEILIQTVRQGAMKDPRVLNVMDSLQTYLETEHKKWVKDTSSLVNVTKETYKALNEGDEGMYIIPQDPHVSEQTLFLFNNANPKDRLQLVSDDYSTGRVTVNLSTMGSYDMEMLMNDVQSHIDQLFASLKDIYPQLNVTVTGGLALETRFINYLSWSQVRSFGLALVVISLLFFVIFGSKRVGLIAIIPNLLPILTIFGVMGYLDIPLDVDTLLTAPIVIGIVVDDTIHFLTHYRAEIQRHADITTAIVNTFREVGQAIVFTSIVLSLAFLNMLMLSHQGLKHFGLLSTIAIITALLCDLFLLPSLCVLFNVRFGVALSAG